MKTDRVRKPSAWSAQEAMRGGSSKKPVAVSNVDVVDRGPETACTARPTKSVMVSQTLALPTEEQKKHPRLPATPEVSLYYETLVHSHSDIELPN